MLKGIVSDHHGLNTNNPNELPFQLLPHLWKKHVSCQVWFPQGLGSELSGCYKVLAFASCMFSILESMNVTLWYYFLCSTHKQILYVLNVNSFNCLDNVSELQKPYSIIMTAQT